MERRLFRYAEARRFERPSLSGRLEAGKRVLCPQPVSRLDGVTGPSAGHQPESEDCLSLVVTRPAAPAASAELLPIVVFFHGGGFGTGSGLSDWYDGSALAAEGEVMVVGVNYRLGPFGYLVLDGVCDGNLGLLDQLTSLHWVRRYATELGGDPDRVTVMGQSAGAISIDAMIELRDPHRPLFGRAILQSGPLQLTRRSRDDARIDGDVFERLLGRDPRRASTTELVEAAAATARIRAERVGNAVDPAFAIVGGEAPQEPAGAGSDLTGLDVLVGWNSDEMTAFGASAMQAAALTGDLFADPCRSRAGSLHAAGATVSSYELTWRPSGSRYGATHCLELALLLGDEAAWSGAPMLGDEPWHAVERYGRQLRRTWSRFAREGTVRPPRDVPMRWQVAA